ncbi:hypothetical protein AABM34_20900 [Lysinibacillus fusiformis]
MKKLIVVLLCIFLLAGCTEAVKTEQVPVTAGTMRCEFILLMWDKGIPY